MASKKRRERDDLGGEVRSKKTSISPIRLSVLKIVLTALRPKKDTVHGLDIEVGQKGTFITTSERLVVNRKRGSKPTT